MNTTSKMNQIVDRPWVSNILSVLAGSLFPLALAPTNIWGFGLLSIFLLLRLIQTDNAKSSALRCYLYALGMYGWGLYWIYFSVHVYGHAPPFLAVGLVALLVCVISLPMLVQGYLYHYFFRFNLFASILGFAILWTIREWLFTWVLTGFPWLFMGYGHLESPLGGYAPYFGVLGIGFLGVLSAGFLYILLCEISVNTKTAAAVILVAVWATGSWLTSLVLVEPEGKPISVSIIQGNIDQNKKWRRDMVSPIIQKYLSLSESEWGRDFIIWPEAAITVYKENAQQFLGDLDQKAKKENSAVLLGLPDRNEQGDVFNAAIIIGQGEGTYYKRLLVPFGEYVPFENQLRGLIKAFDLPMSRNMTGPQEQALLQVGDLKVALSICYEIIYPELVRKNREVADVLVTISNDTWFGASIGPLQHMQIAQMRALENGRYLLRGTNSGVTAIVDPRGKIVAKLPQFQAGVLRGEISRMKGTTPYTQFGDMLILSLIFGFSLCLMIWRFRYTR
ncbi:MAG: apolipoprotein N-acyltransferase [Candidatus Azotimanducaceae bacterium]|jgi:apolipoprotein N-acyltransferase